jgi:hypothetical protein
VATDFADFTDKKNRHPKNRMTVLGACDCSMKPDREAEAKLTSDAIPVNSIFLIPA